MYYIYEIWDKENNIPIYVGYGKHDRKSTRPRYEDHLYEALAYREGKLRTTQNKNMYKINVLLTTTEIEYKFPYEYLSYVDACKYESELIAKYGRRINNTGTLTNLDSGGRGGMTRSDETKEKISKALSGRPSPTKGMKLGPYSPERIEKTTKAIRAVFNSERGEVLKQQTSDRCQGRTLSDEHKKKISETLTGRPSPMKGKTAWNNGLTKETDERLAIAAAKQSDAKKGKPAHNKGKPSNNKGKTYEEIYGKEVADRMRKSRSETMWINNGKDNKKIKKSEMHLYTDWTHGRIMPSRKNTE